MLKKIISGKIWTQLRLHLGSASLRRVKNMLAGKSIAVVGNAESILKHNFGRDIDSHDIVIRMNLGYKVKNSKSQGRKTTILTVAAFNFLNGLYEDKPECELLSLMSNKVVQYSKPKKPYRKKYFVYPESLRSRLANILGGARPTSGAMMIFLALLSDAAKIDLYGFDFFKSYNFYERRKTPVPHDFNAEENWAGSLAAAGKITIYGNDNKTRRRVLKRRPLAAPQAGFWRRLLKRLKLAG